MLWSWLRDDGWGCHMGWVHSGCLIPTVLGTTETSPAALEGGNKKDGERRNPSTRGECEGLPRPCSLCMLSAGLLLPSGETLLEDHHAPCTANFLLAWPPTFLKSHLPSHVATILHAWPPSSSHGHHPPCMATGETWRPPTPALLLILEWLLDAPIPLFGVSALLLEPLQHFQVSLVFPPSRSGEEGTGEHTKPNHYHLLKAMSPTRCCGDVLCPALSSVTGGGFGGTHHCHPMAGGERCPVPSLGPPLALPPVMPTTFCPIHTVDAWGSLHHTLMGQKA